jgi:hypothetical protein
MRRKVPLFLVFSAALGGCATKPVAPDTTPQHATAVIEKHVSSNGIRGFVPFETDETDYVRADMRRDDSAFKGTGTITRFLVGSHSGTRIFRVDRKLLWTLNADDKEYTECPLQGCPVPHPTGAKPQPAPKEQQPQAHQEPGCTMHIAQSRITVTPTGKRENINGFDTEEYKIAWNVTLRDNKRRASTSKLDVDLWTTAPTQSMRDAMEMNAAYGRAFAAATGESAGGAPEVMPKEAARMMMSYLGASLRGHDYQAFFKSGSKLDRIKGHPIRTILTWDITGNACAPKEQQQAKGSASGSSTPTSVSGLVGMFAERETKKAAEESAAEPLLSFTVEVRQLKVAQMHDSLFSVPQGYKRVQPK